MPSNCFAAWDYPKAPTDNTVDIYHGTSVPDPYRPLEVDDATATQEWVTEQNRLTDQFLEGDVRSRLRDQLTALWNYPRYSVPERHGDRYFFSKNDGLQNQSVVFIRRNEESEPEVIIDPNTLSEDGTIAMSGRWFSYDGTHMAYGLSEKGSDQKEVWIRNLDTGTNYAESLKWCKFTSIAWKHDNSGFFYNRFPEPGTVPAEDENNFSRVYWHRLGTDQKEDVLVYERPEDKELGFSPYITEDGDYLVLYVFKGTDPKNRIYVRRVEDTGPFQKLLDEADASYDPIDNRGSLFYFKTDLDAPKGRIIAIDLARPNRENWREILPEGPHTIDFVSTANEYMVISTLRDAASHVALYDYEGKKVREIELPTLGAVDGVSGRREDPDMFFGFTSFLYPPTVFRYTFESGALETYFEPAVDFQPEPFETKQVFAESKDGTRVPIFVTHKKGISFDGSNPTLLYGYGGFTASLTPFFSLSRVLWLEAGGVFAVANTRGGGEYGEDWHQAGILERKQNVFDDFIAAAEHLVSAGYTSPNRIAIQGGSNGGLLVAACMVQRPDLFGAVLCQVPVIDMLRYHKFTVGRYWTPEYGNAEESADHFSFLKAYSPLHNVQSGVSYPPILITTGDTDDRVAPLHSRKFAATLQAEAAKENPVLLRVEIRAGHGGGKPTTKIIEETADTLAFLFKVFDMKLPEFRGKQGATP